jgi:hypothetical protein
MNHPKLFLLMAALAIATVGACKRNSVPAEQTAANPPASGEQFQHPQGGEIKSGAITHFKGSIGNTLGLQMRLVRDGERLTGSYFYTKVGTPIDIRGTLDQGGNVVLEEFDASGKQTGAFKGVWKVGENQLIEVTGNWAKPNGDKKTPFTLTEQPIELSNGVEIVARQIQEKNKKLKYEVAAEYPQVTGSVDPKFEKFNQAVRSLVTKTIGEFKAGRNTEEVDTPEDAPVYSQDSDIGIGYTVALAKDDWISIQFDVGSYESGAAHPNSHSEVINFDLKNGRQLKLADLFKPGSKYLQALSAYCIEKLTKRAQAEGTDSMLDDPWIERGAAPDSENFGSWTMGKAGLGITFDAYQVAPYAAGPQYVLVPYSALKEIINPDGPLAQFVK